MQSTSNGHTDLYFGTGDELTARYTSGLTIHEEALIDGRWVGCYWVGTGFVEARKWHRWVQRAAHVPKQNAGLDLAAFYLEVDGQALHWGWELVRRAEEPASQPHCRHAVVELRNTLRPVTVQVHTEVDGTGLIVRWLQITNTGSVPAALGDVWPLSGVLARVGMQGDWRQMLPEGTPLFEVGYMAERSHCNEGAFEWQPLPDTPLRLESREGTAGFGSPFFVVRNLATGEHYVGGLAWSGNWAIELVADTLSTSDAWLFARLGPVAPPPQRVIAPGETVTTPAVHIGLLQEDLDGTIQAWHKHLRQSVLRQPLPNRENLVTYNHWSYHEHEFTEENLKFEVDVAADIGAELFIVDAGWYGDRGSEWGTTVGDWETGDRLPHGLEAVFDHAREKGLLCGLWVELESMGLASKTARAHPEWELKTYGRPTGLGRMDLTNPDAVAHLEQVAVDIIERYNLDLFRLDHNTQAFEGGQVLREGYRENSLWRYYENVHGMYDRLRARFPHILMENCAGGGGRTDLGFMSRFHYTQATDWQLAPRCVRIYNGQSIALPPERLDLKAGVGMAGDLRGDLDFVIRSCLFGHLCLIGLYPGPGQSNPQHLDRVRHHVNVYKECLRPWLSNCRMYHHTPVLPGKEPRGWAVWELAAEDRSRAAVGIFRLAGPADESYPLRLRGIDAGRRYRVTWDNTGESYEREGAALKQEGLWPRLARPMTSDVLLLEAVD